jgi:hypothetical protein
VFNYDNSVLIYAEGEGRGKRVEEKYSYILENE